MCWTRTTTLGEIEFHSRPTLRFHGSIPALIEQIRNLMDQDTRTLLAAPHQGEVERLATVLREYEVPYRLGSRIAHAGSETLLRRSRAIWPAICATPVIVRTPLASRRELRRTRTWLLFGAQDLFDEADVTARPEPEAIEDGGVCL